MFWRRKNEGFDWHKYVRTTIKLRRDDRRRRVKAAKDAAIEGLEHASRASLEAGKAGAASVAFASVAGAKHLGRATASGAGFLGQAAAAAAGHLGEAAADGAKRLWAATRTGPAIAGRSIRRGSMQLGSEIARLSAITWDAGRKRFPALKRVPTRVAAGGAIAAIALLAVAIGALVVRQIPPIGVNPIALIPGLGGTVIEGRAVAITGDVLRINNKLIRLAGIEAPELDQRCGSGRSSWRCGAAAQTALRDKVRGKTVRCETSGTDDGGRALGTCTIGARDIAGEMTVQGLTFAIDGMFARYAAAEREARNGKLGVWRAAEPEHPKDYRARRWERAKRTAPDGCPIKGHMVSGDRIYVLPWSSQYERVRVSQQRGGRWFCSEREARAAGWRPTARS
jgi:endonuclease YncB( thermonuclease family)